MKNWRYYDVRHRRHLLCNPINKEKFERLCRLFMLESGAHILDMACGKGEFLIRLLELYNVSGVGVDLSPYCIKDCMEKKGKRVPRSDIRFLEMDGVEYSPDHDEIFDLSLCIGASWVYGGHRGTIKALRKMTKPGGLIVVGEPFWKKDPCEGYLKAEGIRRDQYSTHHGNVKIGEEEGLRCLYTLVSSYDDWDHYETLGWWSIENYAMNNPNDSDITEMIKRNRREKEIYLRWGRETMGWAIYVFRNCARKSKK